MGHLPSPKGYGGREGSRVQGKDTKFNDVGWDFISHLVKVGSKSRPYEKQRYLACYE